MAKQRDPADREAGEQQETRRVVCELPNASDFIGGVHFARLPQEKGPGLLVSEAIPVSAAARLLTINGFKAAPDLDEEALDEVDDLIKAGTAAAAARKGSPEGAALQRTVDEQRRSNLAQSEEIKRLNTRVRELEDAKGDPKRVQQLTDQLGTAEQRVRDLEAENQHLRSTNDALGGRTPTDGKTRRAAGAQAAAGA
jgi:hypothetical protein